MTGIYVAEVSQGFRAVFVVVFKVFGATEGHGGDYEVSVRRLTHFRVAEILSPTL
jgi:hypothetical protein